MAAHSDEKFTERHRLAGVWYVDPRDSGWHSSKKSGAGGESPVPAPALTGLSEEAWDLQEPGFLLHFPGRVFRDPNASI